MVGVMPRPVPARTPARGRVSTADALLHRADSLVPTELLTPDARRAREPAHGLDRLETTGTGTGATRCGPPTLAFVRAAAGRRRRSRSSRPGERSTRSGPAPPSRRERRVQLHVPKRSLGPGRRVQQLLRAHDAGDVSEVRSAVSGMPRTPSQARERLGTWHAIPRSVRVECSPGPRARTCPSVRQRPRWRMSRCVRGPPSAKPAPGAVLAPLLQAAAGPWTLAPAHRLMPPPLGAQLIYTPRRTCAEP